jgi:hypothetical protein
MQQRLDLLNSSVIDPPGSVAMKKYRGKRILVYLGIVCISTYRVPYTRRTALWAGVDAHLVAALLVLLSLEFMPRPRLWRRRRAGTLDSVLVCTVRSVAAAPPAENPPGHRDPTAPLLASNHRTEVGCEPPVNSRVDTLAGSPALKLAM